MYFNFKLNIMKLIKGKKYVITMTSNTLKQQFVEKCGVKLPQTVIYNGELFLTKDMD